MTKEEVENVIKRYYLIKDALKNNLPQAEFYTGNRKHVLEITAEVKNVCTILELVYEIEEDKWIRIMIKGIMDGEKDITIMQDVPFSKNAYYARKEAFIQKIYYLCIFMDMVSYEEILNGEIA